MEPIKAIRGMNDILPLEISVWHYVEKILRDLSNVFCYQEIRLPIVEKTELFKRSIGEATDIVEKEMYTFTDRNQEELTLRPEGTAGCVRAGIEHGLFYNQIQRLWYFGPNFRYERPQKGRYRQFYHYGAEIFGLEGPDIDAELILFSATILKKLGLLPYVTLQINSLGSFESRLQYRENLINYFSKNKDALDEDSKRRLVTNPLRILDSKNEATQNLLQNAPKLIDYLDEASAAHFAALQNSLKNLHITFTLNPYLVRGLDYYTKTVFEWVTTHLGAQGTVCAGGRYDGLVEQLGGKKTPALGFALGMERTILLLQETKMVMPSLHKPHIYCIHEGDFSFETALNLIEPLKNVGVYVLVHCGGGNLKSQFKKADKSGADYALILAADELKSNTISIKFLRENKPQTTIAQTALVAFFQELLKST